MGSPDTRFQIGNWIFGIPNLMFFCLFWWLIAIFFALLSKRIALACGFTWVTSFIFFFSFEYPPKWCTLQHWHGWCHMKFDCYYTTENEEPWRTRFQIWLTCNPSWLHTLSGSCWVLSPHPPKNKEKKGRRRERKQTSTPHTHIVANQTICCRISGQTSS